MTAKLRQRGAAAPRLPSLVSTMLPRPSSPTPPVFASPYNAGNPAISAHYDRKQKQRSIMGITAGAEDVKYQAKYKELKKKVKEIESDNDRLYFKLLLAKKNIRRMNLERAILYERLAAVPPTPGRHTQELPAEQDPIFHPQPPAPSEHARVVDPNDREVTEYMRAHPNARLITGPDGRVVAIEDTPAVDPRGTAVPSGPPPPHGVPLVHGFRHDSGPGYDPARQLPPPPPMIPLLQHGQDAPPPDIPAPNDHQAHGYPYAQFRPPPPHQSHSHSSSSHQSRSSSVRPDLDTVGGGSSRVDIPSGTYSVHSRSPNIPTEPQTEHRSRRHEVQELPQPVAHQPPHPHVQIPQQNFPPSPAVSPVSHDRIAASRIHNHQRIGPGAHIHREPEHNWELQQKLQYERELEREREEQRAIELRRRLALEEEEEAALWAQEEARARAHALSRSGSPGPVPRAGGSRDASRPTSGQAQDHDRPPRAYAPHVPNLLGIERDSAYNEDERSLGSSSRERTLAAEGPQGSGVESRKRSRDEMEIDGRYEDDARAVNEGAAGSRGSANSGGHRVSKRTHPDEDGDAGYPTSGKEDGLPDERMDEDA
ncbi:hypothetical protein BD413DRAFT_548652 [Trametes elegans]|nr:hypothetical protein BD413DRAFT_548652 [Trametes elegans]